MSDTRQSAPNPSANNPMIGGDAERIALALGHDAYAVRGGWLISCPVAGHGKGYGDRSPSLSISDTPDGRFLAHCHAGCTFDDVIAALEERGWLSDEWRDAQPPSTARAPRVHEPDATALELWQKGLPATPGSVVQRYLQARGITMIPVPPTLRGAQDRVSTSRKRSAFRNVMIAAVQRPDGKLVSVQRTTLQLNPLNVPYRVHPKITFGALDRGAVRLAAAGEVLGIAEGVESGLSAQQLFNIPCWAALGCRLAGIAIPICVKELHVFADNDEPGRNAAEGVVRAYAGRKVVLRYPPAPFNDWNDALTGFYKPQGVSTWDDAIRLGFVEESA